MSAYVDWMTFAFATGSFVLLMDIAGKVTKLEKRMSALEPKVPGGSDGPGCQPVAPPRPPIDTGAGAPDDAEG